MALTTLYEQVLASAAGRPLVPPRPPRPSASVVLYRGEGDDLEVYWIERAPRMEFMGGWHAFPGGGVSRGDLDIEVVGQVRGAAGAAPEAGMPTTLLHDHRDLDSILAPGVVAAAFRELFEEVGVLPDLAAAVSPERLNELRRLSEAREIALRELLEELGIALDASRLSYAGRWRTPPLGPIGFDNRFFLLEWPDSEPRQPATGAEAASGEWVRPADAVARWRRGEVITAPPILHILEVLAEDGPHDGSERLHEPHEANLGPFRRVEFRPGVVLLPLLTPTLPPAAYTNAYLLGVSDCVLVDPGSSFEREIDWLVAAVEEAPRAIGRTVREIWLTHHHPDHVGGAMTLRERCGLPIAAHEATAQRLKGVVRVDRHIPDGERRKLGESFTVRAIHTPGHASGHLTFLHEELGSLLVGDVVAGFGTIVIDPPDGNMQQYLDTLEALAQLAPRTLFPAHGPPLLDAVGKLEEYRRHRLWREGRVLEAWRSGLRELGDIRAVVYEDLAEPAYPLAERQVAAHLERLTGLGSLEEGG